MGFYLPIIKWSNPIQISKGQYNTIKKKLDHNSSKVFWEQENVWENVKGAAMGIGFGLSAVLIGFLVKIDIILIGGSFSLFLTVPIGLSVLVATILKRSSKNRYYRKMAKSVIQSKEYDDFKNDFYKKNKSPSPYYNSLGLLISNTDIL